MAKPRRYGPASGESGDSRRSAVSIERPGRRLRAANDNRLTWRKRLRQALPLLYTAALVAAALWMMAQ